MMDLNTNPSAGPLRQLLRYMKPYRRKVSLATVYSILNKLFDLAPTYSHFG